MNFSHITRVLIHHVLATPYFKRGNQFFEQLDGVATENSVSPMITNNYMEASKGTALSSATRERHTFEALEQYSSHIQFITEKLNNGLLLILDNWVKFGGLEKEWYARTSCIPRSDRHRPLPPQRFQLPSSLKTWNPQNIRSFRRKHLRNKPPIRRSKTSQWLF